MKHLLFVIKNQPYINFQAQEIFDSILFAASYNFTVSVYFHEKGLLYFETPNNFTTKKNLAKQLLVLPDFDIDTIYVPETFIKHRSVQPLAKIQKLAAITNDNQKKIFNQFDFIIYDELPDN